jgi:hypothetical protein
MPQWDRRIHSARPKGAYRINPQVKRSGHAARPRSGQTTRLRATSWQGGGQICATPPGSDGGQAPVPGVFDPGLQLSDRSVVPLTE